MLHGFCIALVMLQQKILSAHTLNPIYLDIKEILKIWFVKLAQFYARRQSYLTTILESVTTYGMSQTSHCSKVIF